MKFICYFTLLFILSGCSHAPTNCQTLFTGDSGFICITKAAPFLTSHGVIDTTLNDFKSYDSDTIGRYYREANGNYIACVLDLSVPFETHLLLEAGPDGTVLKKERFVHGNYSCCWDNAYSGFWKHDDYFYMTTCNTGSGFCGAQLCVFKTLEPQGNLDVFPIGCYSSFGDGVCSWDIHATVKVEENAILLHYNVEESDREDSVFTVAQTSTFNVSYFKKDGHWITRDSALLIKYGLY